MLSISHKSMQSLTTETNGRTVYSLVFLSFTFRSRKAKKAKGQLFSQCNGRLPTTTAGTHKPAQMKENF